jgi:hypothetical protein
MAFVAKNASAGIYDISVWEGVLLQKYGKYIIYRVIQLFFSNLIHDNPKNNVPFGHCF